MLVSVTIHELFHAFAAHYEGDSLAKDLGYFTLDPIKHLGSGALILLLILGLCWGKCPVNPEKFKHRYGNAIVSFAGPFANFLLVVVFLLLYFVLLKLNINFIDANVKSNLIKFFEIAARANASLVILNLLPIPPLDGSSILKEFIPSLSNFIDQIGSAGFILVLILFMIPGISKFFWMVSDLFAFSILSSISSIFKL